MKKKLFIIFIFILLSLLLVCCSQKLPFNRGNENEDFVPFEINKKSIRLQKEKQYDINKNIVLFFDNVDYMSFQSEDLDIFTVDKDGIITGISEGESEVIITYDDGKFETSSKVVIEILDAVLEIKSAEMPLLGLGTAGMPTITFEENDIGFSNDDLVFFVKNGNEFLEYDDSLKTFNAVGCGEGEIRISWIKDPSVFIDIPFETDFSDNTVGKLIRTELNIQVGPVSKDDLKNVLELDLNGIFINSTNDLSCLVNLKKINLNNTKLNDYSFLSKLLNLEEVYLSSNKIDNKDLLKNQLYLKTLDLSNNNLTGLNLTPQALQSLEKLDLNSNLITDCSFTQQLKNIIYLDISKNAITTACNFSQVNNLEYFDASYNKMTGFSFASAVNKLTYFDLSYNSLPSCNFISQMPNIVHLDITHNIIATACNFGQVNSLEYFDASSNKITSCSFVNAANNLTYFDASYNSLSSCSFISQMSNIVHLDISHNAIAAACSFSQANSLEYFDASYNKITGFSFASAVNKLTYFNSSINSLADCSFISQMPNIEYLDISQNTNIASIAYLSDKQNLQTLIANNCNITQVTQNLPSLSRLTYVDFHSTRINNINFLTNCKDLIYVDIGKIDGISTSYRVSSLAPLDSCTKIKRFLAPNNSITSISQLANCKDLIVLDLANNSLTINSTSNVNYTCILGFKNIQELYLGGNTGITIISFLSDVDIRTNLKRLNLGGTNVSAANIQSYIPILHNLEYLQLYGLNLTSCSSYLTPANFPNLNTLDISHNNLSSSQVNTITNNFKNATVNGFYQNP